MAGQGFDLVIAGAGTAGLACAIAAARRGARVAVVEKTGEVGGTLHLSAGSMSAAATRLQRAQGIADTPEAHAADVLRIGRGVADQALVRLATREAGSTVDWLESLGFEFDPSSPVVYHGYEPYGAPRVYWGVDRARSVLSVLQPLWQAAVDEGTIVPLLRRRVIDLVVEDGRVVGVRVERTDGLVGELRARAVVLATGGYGASRELYAELTAGSPRLVSATRHASTGDGIVLGRRHGGRVRGTEVALATPGGIEQEPLSGRSDWWDGFANLDPHDRPPRELHVNVHGERFVAEDDPSPDRRLRALLAQPDRAAWIVFDEGALAGAPLVPAWTRRDLVTRAALGRYAWSAPDVPTLAALAGIDPAGLVRTIEAWNVAVRTGEDALGRRDPWPAIATSPVYAIRTCAVTLFTSAGLAVDEELRVLGEDGEPIPGLHAAGEVLGGAATSGDGFCTGMLVTPALTFGRILGERLALRRFAR